MTHSGQPLTPLWLDHDNSNGIYNRFDQGTGNGGFILEVASKVPDAFATAIFPKAIAAIESHRESREGELDRDPFWRFRSHEGQHLFPSSLDALLEGLALSLESVARTSPKSLDVLLSGHEQKPLDTVAFLALRAWTAAPTHFADKIACFLSNDIRRFFVGYALGGLYQVSYDALEAASQRCSSENFIQLEDSVLAVAPGWEKPSPRDRGRTQLQLLLRLPRGRMGDLSRSRLSELQRKFPKTQADVPEAMPAGFVDSPIPAEAREHMSDEHWLAALRKYGGTQISRNQRNQFAGGEFELGNSLQESTATEPLRFLSLAIENPDVFTTIYLEAILRGFVQAGKTSAGSPKDTLSGGFTRLLTHMHDAKDHIHGQAIANAVVEWPLTVPLELSDIISWYCKNGTETSNVVRRDQPSENGDDLLLAGINSARGAAVRAAGRLVRESRELLDSFTAIINDVLENATEATCACLVEVISAAFPINKNLALDWTATLCNRSPAALASPWGATLLRQAAEIDYARMRPTLIGMLDSDDSEVQTAASSAICLASLGNSVAELDAQRVRAGTERMRIEAAEIFSIKSAHAMVGKRCRQWLLPMLDDANGEVRRKAAHAFSVIGKLAPDEQIDLLRGVVNSKRMGPAEMGFVLDGIEDWRNTLPDEVADLAKSCLDSMYRKPAEPRDYGSTIQISLPKLVVRLYSQTANVAVKNKCLDLFDTMLLHRFYNVTPQLELIER